MAALLSPPEVDALLFMLDSGKVTHRILPHIKTILVGLCLAGVTYIVHTELVCYGSLLKHEE